MARLRTSPAPAAPVVDPLPLDVVLDGPRPGRDDVVRERVWLDLRREVDDLTMTTAWDIRRMLALSGAALLLWRAGRRAFLAGHFARDPRVRI